MSDAGAGAGRRITVRSVSCRGVKSFVPFQKPPLYAAVSLGDRREKTPADPDGGENPDWDGAVFAFDLHGAGAGDDGLLRFEVKAQVPLLGSRIVGTTCVPVAHLGGGDSAAPRHVSYQVLTPDGMPNGTLSFSYTMTSGAGAYQQPQIYSAPSIMWPEQSSCCELRPPPSSAAYPGPAIENFGPHCSSYPPLQDLLPPSGYPPPPPPPRTTEPLFPAPNPAANSCYPPQPAVTTAYPPPPASCTACSAPPSPYVSSYPPPPPSNYPPPPPSNYPPPPRNGYPPPAPTNREFPASSFPIPTSSYPPRPPPESGSEYPGLPRSTPSSADRALPYMVPPSAPPLHGSGVTYPELSVPPLPSGGSYYPPAGTRHSEESARTPYYYPPPGTRYS